MAIEGDVGARNMIARYPEAGGRSAVLPITAALVDVDTPEALAEVKGPSSNAPGPR